MLEVTVLISGHHRKRNVPGTAVGPSKTNVMLNTKGLNSPANSSNASPSVIAQHNNARQGVEQICSCLDKYILCELFLHVDVN